MSESIVACLAAFRGEHLVLQPGSDVRGSFCNQFPQLYLGLPSVVVLHEAAVESEALQHLVLLLGPGADVLKPHYVARLWVKNNAGVYQLQFVFTCIMSGYFEGKGFKPDQPPRNFYPGHAHALEYVMYWRQRNGFG